MWVLIQICVFLLPFPVLLSHVHHACCVPALLHRALLLFACQSCLSFTGVSDYPALAASLVLQFLKDIVTLPPWVHMGPQHLRLTSRKPNDSVWYVTCCRFSEVILTYMQDLWKTRSLLILSWYIKPWKQKTEISWFLHKCHLAALLLIRPALTWHFKVKINTHLKMTWSVRSFPNFKTIFRLRIYCTATCKVAFIGKIMCNYSYPSTQWKLV